MPLIQLLIYVVLAVLLGYLAIWVLGKLAPGHPVLIDNIIWVVVVLIVALELLQAFGLTGITVPRLR
jgi:hypothetical protein